MEKRNETGLIQLGRGDRRNLMPFSWGREGRPIANFLISIKSWETIQRVLSN